MRDVVIDQEHARHGATAWAWIEPGGDPPAARLTRITGQFAAEPADALGNPGQPAAGNAGYAGAADALAMLAIAGACFALIQASGGLTPR